MPLRFGSTECALIPAIICLVILCRALNSLRQTTLAAPIAWCLPAIVAALPAYYHNYRDDVFDGTYYRYTDTVLLIAPTLALLGAKRPQNWAWQFIVLTLMCVLLLPVAQAWAFGERRPTVPVIYLWLIAIHVIVGVTNFLPTRFAGPAILFGVAQLVMAWEHYFTLPPAAFGPWPSTLLCLAGSLIWAWFIAKRTSRFPPGWDRLWRDFRDAYGLVWGVRVAERLDVAAKQHGWPVEFAWSGLVVKTESGTLDADVQHRIERELRSHLRRFVSHDWIARRMPS
jgi:hypothetical protein